MQPKKKNVHEMNSIRKRSELRTNNKTLKKKRKHLQKRKRKRMQRKKHLEAANEFAQFTVQFFSLFKRKEKRILFG